MPFRCYGACFLKDTLNVTFFITILLKLLNKVFFLLIRKVIVRYFESSSGNGFNDTKFLGKATMGICMNILFYVGGIFVHFMG